MSEAVNDTFQVEREPEEALRELRLSSLHCSVERPFTRARCTPKRLLIKFLLLNNFFG